MPSDNAPATRAELIEALAQFQQRLDQRTAERLGRFAETVAAEFSAVREELGRLRQETNRHLEIIDRRLDRIGETTAPLPRWGRQARPRQQPDRRHPGRPATRHRRLGGPPQPPRATAAVTASSKCPSWGMSPIT